MEPQQLQVVETQLRQNWHGIKHQILDQFPQVSTADITAATSVTDLVQRIADKSGYSDRLVENRLRDLVGVQTNGGQQNQPFGVQGTNQGQPQYATSGSQPFG